MIEAHRLQELIDYLEKEMERLRQMQEALQELMRDNADVLQRKIACTWIDEGDNGTRYLVENPAIYVRRKGLQYQVIMFEELKGTFEWLSSARAFAEKLHREREAKIRSIK